MENFVVGLILITIVVFAIRKIVLEKKRGAKCIGCPHSGSKDNNCGC
jgi:attachment p12 family protein